MDDLVEVSLFHFSLAGKYGMSLHHYTRIVKSFLEGIHKLCFSGITVY